MDKVDFSKGPVWRSIVAQAVPMTIAQLVHLLYNVVDRIFIGHMGEGAGLALAGVGLTFPIVTLIMAVTALFGMGGVPLFSMARGRGDEERAGKVLGHSFTLLILSAAVLMVLGYLFYRPILFAFGASEDSFTYAAAYLKIYLLGTVFTMLSTGLNGYINAQGFPKIGMWTVMIGAGLNIVLDPIFIFGLHMGVRGAALASVLSQMVSAAWGVRFLTGKTVPVALRKRNIKLESAMVKSIVALGLSNFIVHGTNCAVQVACNTMLQIYGGDLFVGVMTVANSIREIFSLPVSGIISGAQPVVSYNYGAGAYGRVRDGIRFNTVVGAAYTAFAWMLVLLFPHFWIGIFTSETALIDAGVEMLRVYFFGFVFMSLQFAGQSTFQAVGDAKHAIFFSLLRKAIIVIPLTLWLPTVGFGAKGVFLAEPISNVIGGTASYLTMRMTVYRAMVRKEKEFCENSRPGV